MKTKFAKPWPIILGVVMAMRSLLSDKMIYLLSLHLLSYALTASSSFRCHNQSDCGTNVVSCVNTQCDGNLKDLFPLSANELYASIGVLVAGIISSGSGLGGGGLLVPLYTMTLQLSPRDAIPLSKSAIFGVSLSSVLVNMRKRHPKTSRQPLIDVDTLVLMEPMTLAGTIIGVTMMTTFPEFLVTILLTGLLGTTCLRTYRKGLKLWKEETANEIALLNSIVDYWQLLPYGKKSQHFRILAFVYVNWRRLKLVAFNQDTHSTPFAPKIHTKTIQCEDSSDENEDAAFLKKDAVYRLPQALVDRSYDSKQKWFRCDIMLLLLTWLILLVTALLKGGHGKPSLIGVECGSVRYWFFNFSAIPALLAVTLYHARKVETRQSSPALKSEYADEYMIWDKSRLFWYPLLSALAGVAAGLLGIGGGMVIGPLLMEMGLHPQVVSATSSTMILFTSSATVAQFIILGSLSTQHALWNGTIGFVAGLIGQHGVSYIVKKYRKTALVVLLVAAVVGTSGITMGILSAIHAYHHGVGTFKPFCPAPV